MSLYTYLYINLKIRKQHFPFFYTLLPEYMQIVFICIVIRYLCQPLQSTCNLYIYYLNDVLNYILCQIMRTFTLH